SVLPQRDELLKGFDLLFIRHAIARMVAEERKGRNLQNRLVNELSPVLEGKVIEVGLDNRDHEVGIVEMFWSMQARAKSLEEWVSALQAVVRHARTGLEMRPEIKIAIEDRFMALTKDRNPTDVFRILKNSGILPVLSEKSVVPALLNEVRGHLGDRPDAAQLQAQIKRVEEALTLREKYPDIYDAFRTDAAEQFKLQPKDVNLVLPKDGTDVVNHRNAENFSAEIRGLSALVGLSRNKSPAEQMELIEYLMGRSTKLPQYIYDAQAKAKQPVVDAARGLQMRLARQDVFERGFITNSFLAGPGSMLETREGLDYVLNYVLRNLDEKDFGMRLARALLRSQGDMKSLFIAYVLSQKPGENGGELTSGQIVRSVFEAFGAAGIKLGQYLAFSNELGKYTADLAALQDSAMPLSYLAIIRLIDKRFGGKWYNEWFIADVLGSGSVNVAVRLEHRVTKEIRVLSILRDEIEIASRDDFRNLNVFVAEFIRSEAEAERRRLQFLPGLLKFVQRSLNLEFDKLNAYLMQKMANGSYIHDFESGWKVRSVRAEGHGFGGLFTSLATGKSARKIKTRDFKLYKEAMLHLMEVEIDFLFGVDASGKPKPVPFIANADLHDGQVIIDAEKKILFILDFGQAVTITNEQRELAIELLKAVQAGRFNGIKSALNNLQANFGVKGQAITDNEIGEILKRTDFMDRFIFMLGLLEGKSWDLPLSSIHWVFSLNRLIQLGEQVGVRIKPAIGALLYSRKLGTSLERFNQLRLLVRSARETIGYPSLPIRTPLKPTENRAAGLSCRSAVAQ
ncbi:MAG TPA: hypothetical protein VFV50_10195, partial [Bdellovibrionales bacterium]|nr:hypothetical protein [Bdellovibrionales bacterium]